MPRPSLRAALIRRPSLWRIVWGLTGLVLITACCAAFSIARGAR